MEREGGGVGGEGEEERRSWQGEEQAEGEKPPKIDLGKFVACEHNRRRELGYTVNDLKQGTGVLEPRVLAMLL